MWGGGGGGGAGILKSPGPSVLSMDLYVSP